ncbi:Six-hairpin glycosidase [Mytilinidion resinicola]|uniref:Six-hairpin glycosidase n=1 Tax=Mytilinidion resinicola TaxID=574789 RepID=A0A6A6YN97_9PEZI|nr:Six-hairpin glycosidase [Mytilinidion resinicola]KAF2810053.1 Six-hairpin glycosidase [Mytilinidion resinicola]
MKYLASALPLLFLYNPSRVTAASSYADNSETAIKAMNDKWYNTTTGLWDGLWWNSANTLTAVINFALVEDSWKPTAQDIISNTYAKAPNNNEGATSTTFLNDFYDDEGWWALALIAAYDLTGNHDYLDAAIAIFDDMTTGWSTPCNGGIWWSKDKHAVVSIANELFLSVAAHLANRVSSQKDAALSWANATWSWFSNIGVIAANNTIHDGVDASCKAQDNSTFFTYNQGVILGGLVELSKATGESSWIDEAHKLAAGALAQFANGQGNILTEFGGVNEDNDLAQFKGIFIRNLAILEKASHKDAYTTVIKTSADSLWKNDQSGGLVGPHWQGPFVDVTTPSQSSAIDCLVAAAAVL